MSPPGPGRAGAAHDGQDVVIRPLGTLAERRACVALQERVWGAGFSERVPASMLMIAAETGGIASGAFVGDELVAFVFGITGVRADRRVHWSDMLAVAPEYRGRGLGTRLKLHQRTELLDRGVERVLWTFDPLEARNAHLNLNRLGAFAREYRQDVYGASDSPLHAGLGTDRLVAEWPIGSNRVAGHLESQSGGGDPAGRWTDATRVEIPADIQALKSADPEAARGWRDRVRAGLEEAFADDRVAVALERGEGTARYVLISDDQARALGFSL